MCRCCNGADRLLDNTFNYISANAFFDLLERDAGCRNRDERLTLHTPQQVA